MCYGATEKFAVNEKNTLRAMVSYVSTEKFAVNEKYGKSAMVQGVMKLGIKFSLE